MLEDYLSLFSTNPNSAGFRLQNMEVYNWGTFHEQICKISPQGNNSLLTGANASGKSTLIDALLTLLVPTKNERFYNQSSGVEKKGDRTEESYVLGNYGNIQQEGESSTTTQRLRKKDTYSIILATFTNTDQRIVTLFQVRWFTNDELKRSFGIAHEPLEIEKDFFFDGSKGTWKKILEKKYNSNTTKKIVEFFAGPVDYGERICKNVFKMRSEKGLTLFNQIVGVKVLNDLDEFIRNNMLEERNSENEYVQLNESFSELMEAKIKIDKTNEQIKQLQPIDEIANKLIDIQKKLRDLQQIREKAERWFIEKKVELAEKELEKYNGDLENLNMELDRLEKKESDLEAEKTDLIAQIKADTVGNQIENLKKEISELDRNKNDKINNLDNYNKMLKIVGFSEISNEENFRKNRELAKEKKNELEKLIAKKYEELILERNKENDAETRIKDGVETIKSLKKNRNNIPIREAKIREDILNALKATTDEIPFIGELLRVKDSENEWESAIEKILHNFALRLLVPEEYYYKVNEYVNSNNLNGRIIYQRYKGFTQLKEFENKKVLPNSLFNKIEFKPKNYYTDWLEDIISKQYNYSCVNDLQEFNRYEELAVTKEGLIKSVKGKHEKDDRPYILGKENYVLGWDNEEKIKLIQVEIRELQEKQKQITEQINTINESIKNINEQKEALSSLFGKYTEYDDIDWEFYAKIMQEKIELKNNLENENENENIRILEKRLQEVKNLEKQIKEYITETKEKIFEAKHKIKNINDEYSKNKSILLKFEEMNIDVFELENILVQDIFYENIEEKEQEFKDNNDKKMKEYENLKNQNEHKALSLIRLFKVPPPEITEKFKDWRSETHALPESIELISEYQSFYKKLIDEDLAKFKKKFDDYLHETIINKISDFRRFFEEWLKSIEKNIGHLNDSLKGIDFNNTPTTYIQLVKTPKIGDEVKEFRNLLEEALPNYHRISTAVDGLKNHFYNHIQPLIEKLRNEQWRKKVTEVRSWFNYKAEEFYKETKQKHKTYEGMGQLSGGEKAQLTYTILGSAIDYQFGLLRFIAIDEAFKSQDEDKARYLISLCKQLHLQLLVVTPSDNIHIVQNDISFVHYVERNSNESKLYNMPIKQFNEEREKFINDQSR